MIDSHHHFWKYTPQEFDWIGDEMSALRRDFGPRELQCELSASGVDSVITVEARQTLEETGWLPLASPDIESCLEHYAAHEKLKGVRHVVQAEPDGFLARADFNRGIAQLRKFNLVYDILIIERQLPESIEFVDRHPEQQFVLDHLAKPLIRDGVLEPWRTYIQELARRDNVACKISGMVTEADFHNWTAESLQPYWETALEAFGPQRLMFGSDWPVCLAACEYARWVETVQTWSAVLSMNERAQLFGETAMRSYRLAP